MTEEKKPMSAGRIVLIVIGTLMLIGFATCATCAVCVGGAANEVAKQERAREAQVQEMLTHCPKAEETRWADIAAALKENEARVAAFWKGNCVKVSGVVERIDSDISNAPVVSIGSGERFSLNTCRCRPQDPSKALKLSKGQKITVWGIGGDEIIGSLSLEHCDW